MDILTRARAACCPEPPSWNAHTPSLPTLLSLARYGSKIQAYLHRKAGYRHRDLDPSLTSTFKYTTLEYTIQQTFCFAVALAALSSLILARSTKWNIFDLIISSVTLSSHRK